MRAQPSARRPPAARGGFRHHGTSRRQTPTSAQARRRAGNGEGGGGEPQRPQPAPRHAPALEPPQAARLPPRLSQGPAGLVAPQRIPQRKLLRAPALGEAPASGPWGFRHHGTSRRQTPTSAHSTPAGPGTGKSGGEPQRPQPRHAPALEPPASRGAYARLSQGPMVCYSRRALPAGRGAHRATRPAPSPRGPPYSMFRYNAHLRKQRPSSPSHFGRGGDVLERGGETTPPLSVFEKRYAACPGPRLRVALAGGARARRGGRGRPRHG